jgi:ATP-dependent Clp protease ATP-binding subunit ClpA
LFERFTDSARRAVVHAREEARRLDHEHIGTEHLFLGLLHDDTEGSAQAFGSVGVRLDEARAQVEELTGRGTEAAENEIPFTPRAKKVLELSLREALQLGHDYIGSEHIVLGLLREGEGSGIRALRRCDADPDDVRRHALALLRSRGPAGRRTFGGGLAAIESRLSAIESRLERIERLLGQQRA